VEGGACNALPAVALHRELALAHLAVLGFGFRVLGLGLRGFGVHENSHWLTLGFGVHD